MTTNVVDTYHLNGESINILNHNASQNVVKLNDINNFVIKSLKSYICQLCDYSTSKKSNYDSHLSSEKHIKKVAANNYNFYCESCDYSTSKKSNYDKHLSSKKHSVNVAIINHTFICEKCNYTTNNKFCYDKHIKTIKHKINNSKNTKSLEKDNNNDNNNNNNNNNNNENNNNNTNNVIAINNDTLDSIMSEIKTLMIEQNKMNQIITDFTNKPISNITNNNNQTNNHQFNMNMFLNETCKDAMNMSEFIENLTVTMEDMEMTGTLGFAKGMSRIIMNNLNALEVHKRPIHCSDAKRETLYVKNNGVWEKDTDDKKHTKELIYKVSSLNLKHLLKWRDLPRNKGYDNPEHKKNDEFTILVMEINKVKVEEIEKVVTIISKNVTIDKNKVRMSGYLN